MEAALHASELDRRMKLLRDEQLAEMAFSTPSDGIIEEAVAAAKEELDRRGISASDMSELEFHVATDEAEDIAKPDAQMGLAGILFDPGPSARHFAWRGSYSIRTRIQAKES